MHRQGTGLSNNYDKPPPPSTRSKAFKQSMFLSKPKKKLHPVFSMELKFQIPDDSHNLSGCVSVSAYVAVHNVL